MKSDKEYGSIPLVKPKNAFNLPPVNPEEEAIRACIAVVAGQTAEKKLAMEKEHNDQANGFAFEATRFGDFLTLSITRAANTKTNQKHAITLNLGKVDSIALEHGKPVEIDTQTFQFHHRIANKGLMEEVERLQKQSPIRVPDDRPFWHLEKWSIIYGHGSGMYMRDYQQQRFYEVDDVPAPSVDDIINFHGVDKLTVPFGLGEAVFEKIMIALEKGWDKPTLPLTRPKRRA